MTSNHKPSSCQVLILNSKLDTPFVRNNEPRKFCFYTPVCSGKLPFPHFGQQVRFLEVKKVAIDMSEFKSKIVLKIA